MSSEPADSESVELGEKNVSQQEVAATPEHLSGLKLYILLFGLSLAVLLVALDNAILATVSLRLLAGQFAKIWTNCCAQAIPTITIYFSSIEDVGWYASAYLLASCSLQPLSGRIYMQFSLKVSPQASLL
jgi:hypothetical protein